jgi:signal transduction histidine kinase
MQRTQRATPQGSGAYRRFLVLSLGSLVLSLAAIVVSSLAVSRVLHQAVSDIARNAVPSMARLADARSDLREVRRSLADVIRGAAAESPPDPAEVRRSLADLGQDIRSYKEMPPFPGESELWAELDANVDAVDSLADRVLASRAGSPAQAEHELQRTSDLVDSVLLRAVSFNAAKAQHFGDRIEDVRRHELPFAVALSVWGNLFAIAAIFVAWRLVEAARARTREAHDELQRRAGELEAFSGRVAHDLLSPLMSVSLALDIVEHRLPSEEVAHTGGVITRAGASLARVRELVEGLLQFARAGARPLPGARAEVREIVQGTVEELRPLAERSGVALVLHEGASLVVSATPGCLISVVSNLVRNAVSAVSKSPVRKVDVRLAREGALARVEVADTGPGVEPEVGDTIFEPHVRGAAGGSGGSGLGLATVKRLVESYGGSVGVVSAPGAGARFWVTLPLAEGV